MAKKFLTLDIGAANLALAEYESAGSALTLVNYGLAPLAAPLDAGDANTIIASALAEIVREKGIRPGPVAVSVSGQMVFPRFAAIPFAGGADKFDALVRSEIELNVPFPIDEMVCDYQVIGETENGDKSVMIVAAKRDQIEAITGALTAAGFEPTLVDVAPIALTNAIRAAGGGEECTILLDIGAKTTSLVIVEGDKIYNRSIPIAGNTITKEIVQALGCTAEEAEALKRERGYVALGGVVEDEDEVADRVSKVCRAVLTRLNAEVSRSVNFYRSQQGGGAPVKLYLTGGSALLPQTDRFFSESLQVEVEYFNPFEFVKVGPRLDAEALGSDAAMLAATAGVALHSALSARFAIDLLPSALKSVRAERKKIPCLAAAAAVIIVALGLAYVAADRAGEAMAAEAEAVSARVNTLKGFEAKLKAADGEVAKAKAQAESFKTLLASRSRALTRIMAVRNALPAGMWVHSFEGGKATIRGWSDQVVELEKKDAGKSGKSRTAAEIVVAALKQASCEAKIAGQTEIDKDIRQFIVEVTFK